MGQGYGSGLGLVGSGVGSPRGEGGGELWRGVGAEGRVSVRVRVLRGRKCVCEPVKAVRGGCEGTRGEGNRSNETLGEASATAIPIR